VSTLIIRYEEAIQ